jgi:opacity protein-like surface antigen
MKKLLVLIAFLAGITLSAQDRADVSLSGSVLNMSSATNNNITRMGDTSGGALGSFRFWATPRNGFEFNYGHATLTQSVTMGGSRTSVDSGMHEISGAYIFRPRATGHIQPFFGGGAAFLQFNPKKDAALSPTLQSQNKPGALYLAGIDYMFSRHLGVRAEFRGLVFAAPSFMNEMFRSNTMHHTSEPTFGIVYRF